MLQKKLSRRNFLKMTAITTASAALASCQPSSQPSPAAAPTQEQKPADTQVPVAAAPKSEPVTLKWWDFPRGWAGSGSTEKPNAWNEDLSKQYMDANPNVKMEFTGVSWSDGPQKLDVALAADQGPDVMYGYPALFGKMLSLNVLQPIDNYVTTMKKEDVDDFFESGWKFVTVDGKKMAFPWYYATEGEWVINTTIVKEAKAEDLLPAAPSYSWTPDQMVELAKKCTFKRDNGDAVWGLVIHTSEQQGINLWPLWSFPYMYGASLYNEQDKKSDFGSDAGVKSFQLMYDLVNTYKVSPPGAAGLTGDNVTELWNRKQNTIQPNSGVETMIGLKKALEAGTIQAPFEVRPVLPPVDKGQKQKVNGAVGVQLVFAQKNEAKSSEALKFTDWLCSAKNMEVFNQLGKLCARKSTTTKISGDDPLVKWRIDYALPNLAAYSKNSQDIKIDDAWMQALQAMYDGSKSPKDAAMWFQDEANKLLQNS